MRTTRIITRSRAIILAHAIAVGAWACSGNMELTEPRDPDPVDEAPVDMAAQTTPDEGPAADQGAPDMPEDGGSEEMGGEADMMPDAPADEDMMDPVDPVDPAECVNFPGTAWCEAYAENLAKIKASSFRSRVEDTSPFRDTPQDELVIDDLLGPRSDYVDLDITGGDAERSFPTDNGVGNFRVACEFSHFAYDDPFMHPGQPGKSYLQMFFGNTDVNAYSTYESLRNTGGASCNGHELNRSGYWVPAMFDGDGNVRVPDRVVIYYKGYGRANGAAVAFPEQAAIVSKRVHVMPANQGGAPNEVAYKCSDQFSANNGDKQDVLSDLNCDTEGNPVWRKTVLEVVVKFPQCYVGNAPADFENSFTLPRGNWFGSNCEDLGYETLPNIEYFVNYALEDGETTDDWFLASDVSPDTFAVAPDHGGSINGKWWGAWRKEVNQEWVDECVNYQSDGVRAGCGFGYLSDAGPDGENPRPGRALKIRHQYTGPIKVPAATVFEELCTSDRTITTDAEAAWCNPD